MMTLSQTQTMRAAIGGDEVARHRVALRCLRLGTARRQDLYSKDPAVTSDDLEATFYEGVLAKIHKAKLNVGDPYMYLVQCGIWAVLDRIRQADVVYERIDAVGGEQGEDAVNRYRMVVADADTEDEGMGLVAQSEARKRIQVLVDSAKLTEQERAYMQAVLEGTIDPTEIGSKKQFAELIGVCPQRASQILNGLHKKAVALTY